MNPILKSAYDLFPFKKEAFIVLQNFYHPPRTLYQRLNFNGPFRVKFGERQFILQNYEGHEHVIENEIFWNGLTGGWEKASLALWIELCSSSDTIFDVGANTGIYSLIAKAVRPSSTVYAFEPMPQIYKQMQTNVYLNNYDIHGCNVAVSNRDGLQKIFNGTAGHTYTASLNRGFDQNSVESEVRTIKLSSFIREEHISAVDAMKIDVETYEVEVLQGMEEFLEIMKPAMLIEILTSELGGRVEKLLDGKGYEYYSIDEVNGPAKVDNLRGGLSRNFLICTPEKREMIGSLSRR
ncbi:MAG: FkbM family methyltransferase [Bacteroidota bacterium]